MNSYGLFIGINNYPGTRLDLSGCVNDAQDWRVLLGEKCESCETLLDRDATRENILGQSRSLLSRLKVGDWGYITFSGHGSWVPDEDGDEQDGRDECLIPYDYDHPILDDELHELMLGRTPGSNLLLIADSCHSGTVSRLFNPTPGLVQLRFMPPDVFLPELAARRAAVIARQVRVSKVKIAPGLVLMAGCADHEFCYDASFGTGHRPNGAFTRAAIDSLAKMRKTSSFTTWHRNVRETLPSYQYPQSPKLNARKGESGWALPWRA